MPRAKNTPEDIAIGEKLRAYRSLKGMSQADLGKPLGVTFQQVQKYEKGSNRIAGSKLRRAAEALGVTVADLIGDTDARGSLGRLPADVMKLAKRLSALPDATRPTVVKSLEKVVDAIEDAQRLAQPSGEQQGTEKQAGSSAKSEHL